MLIYGIAVHVVMHTVQLLIHDDCIVLINTQSVMSNNPIRFNNFMITIQ